MINKWANYVHEYIYEGLQLNLHILYYVCYNNIWVDPGLNLVGGGGCIRGNHIPYPIFLDAISNIPKFVQLVSHIISVNIEILF